MSAPAVKIQKNAFGTGSAPPTPIGQMAIIAAAATTAGAMRNRPASYARDTLVLGDFGYGPLTDYASYLLQAGGKSVVPVQPTVAVPATYGAVTAANAGTGSSTCTGSSTLPLDEYALQIATLSGGTVGTDPIQYTVSFDGGTTQSAVQQLGAGSPPIAVPFLAQDGTKLAQLQFGAGTLVAGATYSSFATRPQPNNTDLPASLLALSQTRQGWEGVLIDCVYASGTVGIIDTWLTGLEAVGQFHFAIINTRHKTQPVPSAESESAFATAMQTLTSGDATDRICVGTDAADLASTLTGITQPRPVALFLAGRAMAIAVGEDPAFVGRGSLTGSPGLSDSRGNPRWHDEDLFPTLDGLRLVTLRSFPIGGPQGVYITNANILSEGGSDFVWLQHLRVMNYGCTIAWQVLTTQLSIGVAKAAPNAQGQIFIAPEDADRIDGLVNAQLTAKLKGQCTAVEFTLATDDDLSANSDSTVHGSLEVESLAYLKQFLVTSSFVKTITVKAA